MPIGRRSWRGLGPALGLVAFLLAPALPARAQSTQPAPEHPPIGSTLPADALRDLPIGDNIYAALETTQPEVIADRFNSAGLNAGEPARVGAFLASWSQTLFRIGDIDVSDPTGSGAPLLFPESFPWRQVGVATGLMPIDVDASGLAVTFEPRRPTDRWTTSVEGSGSGGSLASSTPDAGPPPIARLRNYGHGSAVVSGPLSGARLGIAAGGAWTSASKFERESLASSDSGVASAFANVVFTPSSTDEWRTFGWVQRAATPFAEWQAFAAPAATTRDVSSHVQSTWSRATSVAAWRVFGGFTERSRTNTLDATSAIVDRLQVGPIPDLVAATGDSTARRWQAGVRVAPHGLGSSAHAIEFGADANRATATDSSGFTGAIGELVNGIPARQWAYGPAGDTRRAATTIAAFAGDTMTLSPRLHVDASIRFESVTGGADGAATSVDWRSWLPRASIRWQAGPRRHIDLVAGYARTADRLNLDWLAFGDPAAPTAIVTRWPTQMLGAPITILTPIVARVGPGTGGVSSFSGIDPNLARPYTDEFVVGAESQWSPSVRFTLTGIARRQSNLLGVVNTGVPASSYSTVAVPDIGDPANPADDQVLTVYNRTPASFGLDRYLVTNPGQDAATLFAVKLTAERSTDRMFLLFGATASAAQGSAASRGYLPIENDQEIPGELFVDPNAATYARGRLFSDRAFTIKWTTVYRFSHDIRLGAIARYQDGQPFAKLVIVPGLNQGAEAIRAYANAGSRFTYTGTLDLRLQKGFAVGNAHLDAILDLYNLLTRSNEVEENVADGALFRTPTAIEPPPAVHLGLRVTF